MLKVCEKKEVRKDLTVDEFRRFIVALRNLLTGTHLLRHASLSEHYDTCKDILATAKVAGHSDLRATERYAKARDEQVVETQRQMAEKLRNILAI